jgi:hypothetical protein
VLNRAESRLEIYCSITWLRNMHDNLKFENDGLMYSGIIIEEDIRK